MSEQNQYPDRTQTLRAVIRGYVQGVGFRVFIRSHAWDLEVRGFVQNMPDGTVQVVAAGSRPKLESLLEEIWTGPAGAHVTSIDTEWTEGESRGLGTHFEVRH